MGGETLSSPYRQRFLFKRLRAREIHISCSHVPFPLRKLLFWKFESETANGPVIPNGDSFFADYAPVLKSTPLSPRNLDVDDPSDGTSRRRIGKIVAGGLRRAPAGQGPVLAWALACGHAVAGRTGALDFVQGVLRVEVPDWGWRAELQALAPQYLAVINRYVAESVKRIEFVILNND